MRLLDIEAKGVRCKLTSGGRFRVVSVSALTVADCVFLRASEVRDAGAEQKAQPSGAMVVQVSQPPCACR
jgi:hypothetical protein